MAFVSSPAPAHPSTPQGCTHSTLPGLPAQHHPCMDCSHTNSPLWGIIDTGAPQPPINMPQSETSRPWKGTTEGQLGMQSTTLLGSLPMPTSDKSCSTAPAEKWQGACWKHLEVQTGPQ